jgi:hypothetical protein
VNKSAARDLHFSNGDLPLSDKWQSWQRFMREQILGVTILSGVTPGSSSAADMRSYGPVSITRYDLEPQIMARDPVRLADKDGGYCLSIVESGRLIAQRGSQRVTLQAGQAVLLPASTASRFHFVERSVFWGIKIGEFAGPVTKACETLSENLLLMDGPLVDVAISYCKLVHGAVEAEGDVVADTIGRHIIEFMQDAAPRCVHN